MAVGKLGAIDGCGLAILDGEKERLVTPDSERKSEEDVPRGCGLTRAYYFE